VIALIFLAVSIVFVMAYFGAYLIFRRDNTMTVIAIAAITVMLLLVFTVMSRFFLF
jgi:hypothetical protein